METKSDIRRRMIDLRASLSKEQRDAWSLDIERHLYGLTLWTSAKTVVAYYAMPNEVATLSILESALDSGKQLFLPRCVPGEKFFEAVEVHDLAADLVPGPLPGLMDPRPSLPAALEEQRFDLVLTPGIAFDAQGMRMGFGAGMYDKFLALHPETCRIALAFSLQVLETLPTEPHDAPMHAILTEKKCIVPSTRFDS